MSEFSHRYAKSYATFLVDIYPEDAIAILSQQSICKLNLVEQRVNDACLRLGDIEEIKPLVQGRQFDKLKELKNHKSGAYNYPSPTLPVRTPNVRGSLQYHPAGQAPPSPMSMASGSQQSQRIPSHDLINVIHRGEKFPLTARSSGSEAYLIGEDKLKRFQGLTPNWGAPAQKINIGGRPIKVAQYVQLTWNRPENLVTEYEPFWVVEPGLIQHVDVLLGDKKQQYREGKNKAPLSSFSPEKQTPPPPAPTPPHPLLYQTLSSSGIHSYEGNTVTPSVYQRTSARTATMSSGPPPPHNPPPSQAPSIIDRPPSRPESAQSIRTVNSFNSDVVTVYFSFQGQGKRVVRLDLTKHEDEILPSLEPHIRKITRGEQELDRSIHEMVVTPLKCNDSEPLTSALSDDDFVWEAIEDFIRGNRLPGQSRKPEFLLDIAYSG